MKKIIIPIILMSSLLLGGTAIAAFTNISPGSDLLPPGGILDTLYGLGNLQRVDDDGDRTWFPANGSATAQAMFSDNSLIFGFIPDTNNDFVFDDPFLPLFTVPGGTNANNLGGPSAMLNLGLASGGNPTWTSRPSQNSDGMDHMVTWRILSEANKWVIAWEETSSLGDYSDLVVEVSLYPAPEEVSPTNVGLIWALQTQSNPVPEPATMLLLGTGLVGFAVARFRRKKK